MTYLPYLLSCTALDMENCHATVHTKQLDMSMLEHAWSFGAKMKESTKRLTYWAATARGNTDGFHEFEFRRT